MRKLFNWKVIFVLVIFLAAFLRLWKLGQVPVSLADDEMREAYTSYSIAQTGKDYLGNYLPIVIKIAGYNQWSQSSIYIASLFYKFLPLNPFTARLPYALFGILSVIFFSLVVKEIFGNRVVALLSAAALSVSLWHIQLSRVAMDIDTSLFMYIAGIYFFLKSKNKTYLLILSMFFFFLGFYGYGATKVIFIPLIIILIWYKFRDLTRKYLLIILTMVVLAVGSYTFLSITQNAASYSGNPFFFQNKKETAWAVELERRASVEPGIIETAYYNKFTYWGYTFCDNYLSAFSSQFLFLGAERDGRFAVFGRGALYLIELPLLVLGILSAYFRKRKEFYLIGALLLISPLPSGVSGTTWMSRSGFMIFPLFMFIGFGIYSLIMLFKKDRYKLIIALVILLGYLYSVFGYVSQYYYDWSRVNAKYFSRSTQDLVYLVHNYKDKKKEIIVSGPDEINFIFYAFYNNVSPAQVQKVLKNKPIKFENITFQYPCINNGIGDPKNSMAADTVYISPVSCHNKAKPDSIIRTYDNTEDVLKVFVK